MKIYLASFYSPDLKRSAERFKEQAKKMNLYNSINLYTYDDLNEDFKNYVKELINLGKVRGYGYWVWQTYIHQSILSKMADGDIYHWCDVGCHFNLNGKNRLKEYFEFVSNYEKGFLGFEYKSLDNKKFKNYTFPNYLEYQYTKEDLFKYFDVQNNQKITNTPQVWGGSFFLRKSPVAIKIMQNHFNITRNRFDLIDDDETKFKLPSRNGFISHRHSQSVLSILAKLENCKFFSAYESEWALNEDKVRTFLHLKEFPIIAKRDKKKNIFLRFLDRQKRTLNRYKSKFRNMFK